MTGVSAVIITAYFAILVLALMRRGQNVTHPWLFLLRGFFPSWRFFDAPGLQPRLFVRALLNNKEWSAWYVFVPRATFRVRDLLYNPENNLHLTEQTLIEHLSSDLQALPEDRDAASLVSYSLTVRLARRIARGLVSDRPITGFQFDLRLLPGLGDDGTEMIILKSPIYQEADHAS